jgi:hypothetical protein
LEEIILKKISVFKTSINKHLLETIKSFVEDNKNIFNHKSWHCENKTSFNIYKNILYEVQEFDYIRKEVQKKINESWINIMQQNSYQEFHNHRTRTGAGVLYISDDNSPIEFTIFPEDTRKSIKPKKADLILFDATTFHRVYESDKQRISLAFNFTINV